MLLLDNFGLLLLQLLDLALLILVHALLHLLQVIPRCCEHEPPVLVVGEDLGVARITPRQHLAKDVRVVLRVLQVILLPFNIELEGADSHVVPQARVVLQGG